MDDRRLVRVSKYLAKHLRHQPQRLGLTPDAAGWVGVDALLRACEQAGFALTRAELEEVVARNDKRRFAFDETGARIRASQGHSIGVDLGLRPLVPPHELYHGTIAAMLPAILDEGLRPMGRHHVHLSVDVETARRVGGRRGRPVVLAVDAAAVHAEGVPLSRSDNGVWLVAAVAPTHLRVVER
jgi:putative RNA 2'-phosphotransferase